MYNFTTANTHTYLVDGIVSHNKMPPRPPIGRPPPPPDNRIIQGLGGYLSPSEIEQFVNPPSPNNSAGQQNMADLMKQQQELQNEILGIRDSFNLPKDAPLVDEDGFPLNTIDVYTERHNRVKYIRLQNDYKMVKRT